MSFLILNQPNLTRNVENFVFGRTAGEFVWNEIMQIHTNSQQCKIVMNCHENMLAQPVMWAGGGTVFISDQWHLLRMFSLIWGPIKLIT